MRITALFAICISALFFCDVALAQSLDQVVVGDEAGIFGDKLTEVEAAADKLVVQGAEVRVRTITSYGSAGNLDVYEAQLEQRSPSWLGRDGNMKNNLIVIIISVQERQTGLYYGAHWENALNDRWIRIQTDVMNPLFREGDYAGGTTRGLLEIQRLIQGPNPTTSASQQPGPSKWWIAPVVLLIITGLMIGFILFVYLRRTQERRSVARQMAMLARQGAASRINEQIEAVQLLEIKVSVVADRITPEEAAPLSEALQKARGLVDRSSETYSNLSHGAGDPENPRLREAELGAVEAQYKKILDDLSQAKETATGVESEIAIIQQAIDRFPASVAEVNIGIEKAAKQQDELNNAGYKTTYVSELIGNARSKLEQAKAMVAGKRLLEGMKEVALAGEQVKTALEAGTDLPQKKREAEQALDALAQRIEQVKAAIDSGSNVFERISNGYAETAWTSIKGNGTEAENRVDWALDALDDARSAASPEQQLWPKALESAAAGNQWLTEAESLMKSISGLEENLVAARRDAPAEIAAAQADITKAWEYINRYDEDIRESLEDDLRSAEGKTAMAREELAAERPDYFSVCKLARDANDAADRILVQARDEHEAAERLRVKAASARRDAHARVSVARKYVEDHMPVVQAEARNQLSLAEDSLRQADAASDTNTQIALVSRAESAANQAYTLAQQDVNNSWQRPVPTSGIPRQNTPDIVFPRFPMPTPGRSPGSGPPWGSPRTSRPGSPGTMGKGGGGSSSWGSGGGGGRRGGGSASW
jgi:uncharacterized membrane protein YgcG